MNYKNNDARPDKHGKLSVMVTLLRPGTAAVRFLTATIAMMVVVQLLEGCKTLSDQQTDPIVYSSEMRTNPPQRLFVAQVDLTNRKVHLRVSGGGPDPDGPGKWQTTLMQPTKIADREKFDFVINGDFFSAKDIHDGEGTNSHYHAEQWASVAGPAVTDGRTWSSGTNARPCLVVHKNRTVTIEMLVQPDADDWEVIGGNVMLVHDGEMVPHPSPTRNPRTVAGLDASGKKLTILVVDGRKPGIAAGMSYNELAAEMLRLGCKEAFNFDGGGSSVMAMRDANGAMKILNQPTDGRERAVANVLGISINPP